MSQNSVYKGVLVLLMIGIIAVAWQVTSSPKPVLEMPASEPSQIAVTINQSSAQAVTPAQTPAQPATPSVSKPSPSVSAQVPVSSKQEPSATIQSVKSPVSAPVPTTPKTSPIVSQALTINQSPAPVQAVVEQKVSATADAVITISDFDLEPKQASILAGQTVLWEYPSGSNKHSIGFKNSGPRSPLLMQGDSWQYTFNESGVYEYVDLVFTFMYGKVVVG
ncbi:MAG: hypothetical protein Q7K43_01840 [Candidatus Woesearchaeota archaeon]|nr:hypothetical protein [Candidatus Woesearchaeota archaeon]